ncbi:MAG: PRC-barrel domain-containing protein [Ornithinibacter sp.]
MMFSAAKGHKVVDTSSAATVGTVSGFLVEPSAHVIVALRVKKAETGEVIRWRDITAFGSEAVTVPRGGVVTDTDAELEALGAKARKLMKKRVLTSAGDELGTVKDVDFDPATGALTWFLLGGEPDVAADRLIGVGSYAVVVRAEPHGS